MAYISNRQAKRNYELLETIRAGISLLGTEVKSIRNGKGSLIGAQVILNGTEVYLTGANIPPNQEKNAPPEYDPLRKRSLLLTKKEIGYLYHATEAKNLFLIPVSLYNSGRKIKLDIAISRKKNARDKKMELKHRDLKRMDKEI